ncbi:hypothetical protein BDZ91DRAFT_716830 [Kalaharituber pfeilii]|nr:hypothetical protein BDZ91DRAFT_716830 [Kalaharituber pfeilii]
MWERLEDLGDRLCFYNHTKAIGDLEPELILSSSSRVMDTALIDRWGEQRLREVVAMPSQCVLMSKFNFVEFCYVMFIKRSSLLTTWIIMIIMRS